MEELITINGVGEGKAKKFGASFLHLIEQYVTENDITRPQDNRKLQSKFGLKLYLIQNIDRKLPLDDIAAAKGMDMN